MDADLDALEELDDAGLDSASTGAALAGTAGATGAAGRRHHGAAAGAGGAGRGDGGHGEEGGEVSEPDDPAAMPLFQLHLEDPSVFHAFVADLWNRDDSDDMRDNTG